MQHYTGQKAGSQETRVIATWIGDEAIYSSGKGQNSQDKERVGVVVVVGTSLWQACGRRQAGS